MAAAAPASPDPDQLPSLWARNCRSSRANEVPPNDIRCQKIFAAVVDNGTAMRKRRLGGDCWFGSHEILDGANLLIWP